MGRAKLNMELIDNEKARSITFRKRKDGLIKKMHEFTTLCDVSACMIIYGPKQETGPSEPDIWPQNRNEVNQIINNYIAKKKDSGNKNFGLNDFFDERKKKIEDELSKIRRKNLEARYPTWLGFMNTLKEGQLRQFTADLSSKAELAKCRLEVMKRSNKLAFANAGHVKGQFYPPHPPMHDMQIPVYYPTMDHHLQIHSVNRNSMMMLLMNGEDDQFGGASSSNVGNIQCASFKHQVIYESTAADHRIAEPLPQYYVPPLPLAPQLPLAPPYMVPPPLQFSFTAGWENQTDIVAREDTVQYQMKNHGV